MIRYLLDDEILIPSIMVRLIIQLPKKRIEVPRFCNVKKVKLGIEMTYFDAIVKAFKLYQKLDDRSIRFRKPAPSQIRILSVENHEKNEVLTVAVLAEIDFTKPVLL